MDTRGIIVTPSAYFTKLYHDIDLALWSAAFRQYASIITCIEVNLKMNLSTRADSACKR